MTRLERQVLEETVEVTRGLLSAMPSAGSIRAETSLSADLALDSIQVLELVAEFEQHFGVAIPFDVLMEIDTLAEAAAKIASLLIPEQQNGY